MSRLFGSKICKREYLSSEVARVAKARLYSRLRIRDRSAHEGFRNTRDFRMWNPESCKGLLVESGIQL